MDLEDCLAARGHDIYVSLTEGRDVTPALKAAVLNIARLADTLDRIDIELAMHPNLTVVNSQGTRTVNPLITEARMLTGALSTCLAKMGISELPERASGEKTVFDKLNERRTERQRTANGGSDSADSGQPAS